MKRPTREEYEKALTDAEMFSDWLRIAENLRDKYLDELLNTRTRIKNYHKSYDRAKEIISVYESYEEAEANTSLHFDTHNQCVEYLMENFYGQDFIHRHTRKELAYILRIIEGHALNQSPYAFRSMCKKRMCEHIDFFLKTHMARRLHIEKAELLGCIIDVFEDFLESKGTNIENEDKTGDEGEAIIYGGDYDELASSIESILAETGMLR